MEWISVKDKEPDIEVHVLIFDKDEKICVGYKSQYSGYNHHPMGDFATGAPLFKVLYWMKLPKPPREIKGDLMGIYYYAVDTSNKLYFCAPRQHAVKSPGIYHPNNPFPHMLVMKNIQGYFFEVWDDCSNDIPPENGYEDITDKVYEEYLKIWPKEKNEHN